MQTFKLCWNFSRLIRGGKGSGRKAIENGMKKMNKIKDPEGGVYLRDTRRGEGGRRDRGVFESPPHRQTFLITLLKAENL